jgi:hypothetical protein
MLTLSAPVAAGTIKPSSSNPIKTIFTKFIFLSMGLFSFSDLTVNLSSYEKRELSLTPRRFHDFL